MNKTNANDPRQQFYEQYAARTNRDCLKSAITYAAIVGFLLLVLQLFQSKIDSFALAIVSFLVSLVIITPIWFLYQLGQRAVARRRLNK